MIDEQSIIRITEAHAKRIGKPGVGLEDIGRLLSVIDCLWVLRPR